MTPTREQVIEKLLSLPKEINNAEDDLCRVQLNLVAAQDLLKAKEDEWQASGSIDGKNAEIRTAQLRTLTQTERDQVKVFEAVIPEYRRMLTRAQNEFSGYRSIARLMAGVE